MEEVGGAAVEISPEEARLNAEFESRVYQDALAELSKSRNVIVNLPTGSGKTLIAMKVAAHFSSIISKNEKIFFLAPTVPLVNQQGNKFKNYITTEIVTGGKALTRVQDPSMFLAQTFHAKVIACIPDVFLRWLINGVVPLGIIRLLIVDECHNATKSSPMSKAMDFINLKKSLDPNPNWDLRILGLTATLTKKNVDLKLDAITTAIKVLEQKMDCVALTYDDYEEVLKHSTNANVETVSYSLDTDPSVHEMREVKAVFTMLETGKHNRSFNTSQRVDPDFVDDLYKIAQDVIGIFKDYGLLGAVICAHHKLQYIEELRSKHPYASPAGENINEKSLFDCVYTALHILFDEGYSKFTASSNERMNLHLWISEKAFAVLTILMKYSQVEDLSALVFCQTQVSTYTLKEMLKVLSTLLPKTYGFIKPTVLIGHNNKTQVPILERVTQRKQVKILDLFKKKQFNLIVCTSILEEGVDLQACNVVIRVDPVNSYASVIQSMGRARKFNAKFYALTNVSENASTAGKMTNYQKLQTIMTNTLVDKMRKTRTEDSKNLFNPNGIGTTNCANSTHAKGYSKIEPYDDDDIADEENDNVWDWY